MVSKIDSIKILLIMIILTILGFSVFLYVARGTEIYLHPMLDKPKKIFEDIILKINNAETSIESELEDDMKKITDTGKKIINNSMDEMADILDIKFQHQNIIDSNRNIKFNDEYENTKKQGLSAISGKSGYCYVGSDNNKRGCIQISKGETCMSGDIYPSWDICINPTLRM